MNGGIDEYQGREIDWAVDTVFFNAIEAGLLRRDVSAEELVEAVWDFVEQVYEEKGLGKLDRIELTNRVRSELPDILESHLED